MGTKSKGTSGAFGGVAKFIELENATGHKHIIKVYSDQDEQRQRRFMQRYKNYKEQNDDISKEIK